MGDHLIRTRLLPLVIVVVLGVVAVSFVPQRVMAPPVVQPFLSGLNFPVAFAFADDGRVFFNEKNTGNIRVIASNGTLLSRPLASLGPLPPGVGGTEEGLLGIALDPLFDVNHYAYVYWTYYNSTNYKHSIISRFTVGANNMGVSRIDIFDFTDPNPTQPPTGPSNHNGGYIKFGPDGKLYVEIGDFCSWDCSGNPLAQDRTNLAGKILRMNSDGSVPSDNPFGSLVYAYGYRNGVGMDFSSTGKLIATMAGPDCCDRIFFVNAGANFGWPNCGTDTQPICSSPYTPSIYQFGSPTVTPTGIAYSTDPSVLYFGEFNTGNLMQLILTSTGTVSQVTTVATLGSGILAVERGLDGLIYVSTSDAIDRLVLNNAISFSTLGSVLDATTNSVYFILPDYQGPFHTPAPKCGGVNVAALSDYSAGGYILGMLTNSQYQMLDTNSMVSQVSCGNPTGISGMVAAIAGPGVNTVVHYYEQVAGITPVYFLWDGLRNNFVVRATGQKITVPNAAKMTTAGDDLFLMESFVDDQSRQVYLIYGFSWQGSLAAAAFLNTYVRSHLSSFTNSWYIYEWKDASSGLSANSFPDASDQYLQLATG